MFSGSRSFISKNFPAFIFVASFSGMGEYPGPTTKGLCNKEATEWAKEGVENAEEKNWLVVGSTPLEALWEANSNGCAREELPNLHVQ